MTNLTWMECMVAIAGAHRSYAGNSRVPSHKSIAAGVSGARGRVLLRDDLAADVYVLPVAVPSR